MAIVNKHWGCVLIKGGLEAHTFIHCCICSLREPNRLSYLCSHLTSKGTRASELKRLLAQGQSVQTQGSVRHGHSYLAAAALNMNQPLMSPEQRDLRCCPVPPGYTGSTTTRLDKRDKTHLGEMRKGSQPQYCPQRQSQSQTCGHRNSLGKCLGREESWARDSIQEKSHPGL